MGGLVSHVLDVAQPIHVLNRAVDGLIGYDPIGVRFLGPPTEVSVDPMGHNVVEGLSVAQLVASQCGEPLVVLLEFGDAGGVNSGDANITAGQTEYGADCRLVAAVKACLLYTSPSPRD